MLNNFGNAVNAMEAGKKVARKGWNGKGMFLFLVAGDAWGFESDIEGIDGFYGAPFICMKTVDDKLIPWLASQSDILASDWQEVN